MSVHVALVFGRLKMTNAVNFTSVIFYFICFDFTADSIDSNFMKRSERWVNGKKFKSSLNIDWNKIKDVDGKMKKTKNVEE